MRASRPVPKPCRDEKEKPDVRPLVQKSRLKLEHNTHLIERIEQQQGRLLRHYAAHVSTKQILQPCEQNPCRDENEKPDVRPLFQNMIVHKQKQLFK